MLPAPSGVAKVAVVGPAADYGRLLRGDYHYPAHPELFSTLRIRPRVWDNCWLTRRQRSALGPCSSGT
jgi:hypothetical protein